MNGQTIGTCSICGGAVTLPTIWHGVIPPAPTCSGCGATAAQHGPVIPMTPAPAVPVTEGTGTLRLSPYEHDQTANPAYVVVAETPTPTVYDVYYAPRVTGGES